MDYIDKILKVTDKIKISSYQWKVFFLNMVLVFLMVVLQHLNLQPPQLINPFKSMINPAPVKLDVFDQILPKLKQKDHDYQLKKPSSLIPQAYAGQPFDNSSAYGVIDFDSGEVIASKNLSEKLPIASITKVMSAVVALDLAAPDELFTVSEAASSQVPTKLALVPGEKYTLRELLNAALLVSANDTVAVIEEGINNKYQQRVFVKAMNEKAKFLGMKNSHFTNPQGFDDGSPYSSVEDQAILMHYALTNYPLIAQIVSQDHGELPANNYHHYEYLNNWNGLLGVYPGVFGIKIGNTAAAGNTAAVISQRDGRKLLAIVLGAPGVLERDQYVSELLDLGFEKIANLPPVSITEGQLRAKYQTWRYFN